MDNVASLYARRPPAKTRWCQPGGLGVRSRGYPRGWQPRAGTAAIGPVAAGREAQTPSACIPGPRLPPPRAPLGSANEPSGGHLPNRLALSRRARPNHYPRPLDSPRFATEPGFRLVSDGDFAGWVVLAHHEQQLVLGDGYLKPVDARLESWSALQFTDGPVRLNDPRPSQALRCHVVAAKRRFAAATAGRDGLGLDCRHYVGRSSCPRLLREGFLVARLYDLQGTVSLQAAKPPPTGPPRWPRTICSASPLWQSERSPKPHPDKRAACEMKVLTSCFRRPLRAARPGVDRTQVGFAAVGCWGW
jgi:hypothetical protein